MNNGYPDWEPLSLEDWKLLRDMQAEYDRKVALAHLHWDEPDVLAELGLAGDDGEDR